jgi:hypothetical protein
MLTMLPPRALSAGSAAWLQKKGPARLTSMVVRHSASSVSATRASR